jgi:hypothetical protein
MANSFMTAPTYPQARLVADAVHVHFARHITAARSLEPIDIDTPPTLAIAAIIDAAFWASLRREEGNAPRISLAFLPPDRAKHRLMFATPLPLLPAVLAKVAPAVERPGIHLGVWRSGEEFFVWGTTREVPAFCLVVEVVTPGLLVVKHRSEPFGKFMNVAVLEGDQIKIVDEAVAQAIPDCPAVVTSLVGAADQRSASGLTTVLIQLAASMRQTGHGGTLLVVPAGNGAWRDAIVAPMQYEVDPPYSGLALLSCSATADADDVKRAVDAIAGTKIARKRGSTPVEWVNVTEPVEGSEPMRATPAQLGGTRHLSAAQFVHDQRDATALVASQDGRFTVFKWSPREETVHAHRVDALLL